MFRIAILKGLSQKSHYLYNGWKEHGKKCQDIFKFYKQLIPTNYIILNKSLIILNHCFFFIKLEVKMFFQPSYSMVLSHTFMVLFFTLKSLVHDLMSPTNTHFCVNEMDRGVDEILCVKVPGLKVLNF